MRLKGFTMRGFTLIELLITVAIVALLASVALPLAEVTVQRDKERELRQSLQQVREAIDAYKRAWDEGAIERKLGASGYPPALATLVEGVRDARIPDETRIYFLRRVPRDPLTGEDWGLRSYKSPADDPQEGDDVYDIYSRAEGKGLDGTPYREW
jgi:general secretion pathway protein G